MLLVSDTGLTWTEDLAIVNFFSTKKRVHDGCQEGECKS